MNTRTLIATGMVCATALTIASLIAGAGPLNPPPGPIAPTNKTLAEVEPRIPIGPDTTPGDNDASPSLFKITAPGSYYLTGNITGEAGKHGIEIAAGGVSLSFNGFSLIGLPSSLDGVFVSVLAERLVVLNGSIRGWGRDGLNAINGTGTVLHDLTAVGNGRMGLRSGDASVIERCTAISNGMDGITAESGTTIIGCAAQGNGNRGIFGSIGSTISGCAAIGNVDGIVGGGSSTITACSALANKDSGFFAFSGSTLTDNISTFNMVNGIEASSNSLVLNNSCSDNGTNMNGGAGIHAVGVKARIEGNTVTNNDRGIGVDLAGNLIIGNSASGNTVNYEIAADNRYGPIIDITAAGTPAVAGSAAAGTVNTTDPWANFSF